MIRVQVDLPDSVVLQKADYPRLADGIREYFLEKWRVRVHRITISDVQYEYVANERIAP